MDNVAADQHKAHVAAIAAAYLGNPSVRIEKTELADVIRQIDVALKGEGEPAPAAEAPPDLPSSQMVRKSIDPDFLVSFIDGKRYKTLRRHLATHGHTAQSYRERYGLKPDYPMVAPNYSAQRSELAKKLGLGQLRARSAEPAEALDTLPGGATGKLSKAKTADQPEVTTAIADTSPAGSRTRRGAAKTGDEGKVEASQAVSEAPIKRVSARRAKADATTASPATDEAADATSSGKASAKTSRRKARSN